MERRKTRKIKVRNLTIGGGFPIVVQSMTKTDTKDLRATINQIKELEDVGCELVRVALVDKEAALSISKIKKEVKIPLVGDVHFSSEIAQIALKEGIDKLRLNPGNIKDQNKLEKIVNLAKELKIPIRIGVNAGSLDKKKYFSSTPENLVKSALDYISFLESLNFFEIIVSLKACDILTTIKAYELIKDKINYPFHIGITEAGISSYGTVKSAVGCGILAFLGLADTIRVSLTASPVEEVITAYQILKVLSLRNYGPEVISCPTCGRCKVDLCSIVSEFNKELQRRYVTFKSKNIKVALMGCEVNGPGEAKIAEVGIACGKSGAVLFKKGKVIKKIATEEISETLLEEVEKMIK